MTVASTKREETMKTKLVDFIRANPNIESREIPLWLRSFIKRCEDERRITYTSGQGWTVVQGR